MKTIGNLIPNYKQRGAILVVSLLVLLVLTIIGISSMEGSLMEEKMAANTQLSTTTFQAAESAIRSKFAFYDDNNLQIRAVLDAQSAVSESCAPCEITSNTRMVHIGETPLYNNSEGTFSAHGIEIIGTASLGNIQESNAQGYSVSPMRGRSPTDPKPN